MIKSIDEVSGSSIETEVCVIGTGFAGQTVARQLLSTGHEVLMLEAGGRNPSPEAQELAATDERSVGGLYPNVRTLVTIALGGTSDGPKMQLERSVDEGTGIRLRPLDRVDVEDRLAGAAPGWPIPYEDLWAASEAAAEIFGIRSLAVAEPIELISTPGLQTADFHVADRRPFSGAALDDVGGLDVLLDAPVAELEVEVGGRVSCAIVRRPNGRVVRVHAASFVVATGAAATSRLLLSSASADGPCVAGSSGLVGTGLMDHPIATVGWLTPRSGADRDAIARFAPRMAGGDLLWPTLVPDPRLVQSDLVAQSWATLVPRRTSAQLARLACALIPPIGEHSAMGTAALAARSKVRDLIVPRLPRRARGTDTPAGPAGPSLLGSGTFGQAWSVEDPFWADGDGMAAASCFQVLQCTEQLPDRRNRLVLTDRADAVGRPVAKIHWRWSRDDARRQLAFAHLVREGLADADLGGVVPPLTFRNRNVERWSTHHLSGGTPMSADASTGVVDRWCRTHDHTNLWLTGTAVFPRAGHANPTLTAVATAVIVADDVHAQRP